LRVSELVGLQLDQFDWRTPANIHVIGKGRRERVLPLWKETTDAVKTWLALRPAGRDTALFLNAAGRAMTRSGFKYILAKHVAVAAPRELTMTEKTITPHVLRHSCAIHMLAATRDIRKVALWLGHASLQSTEVYLRADPSEKLEMLESVTPPGIKRGHFTPPDKLIAMLTDHKHSNSYAE